MSVFIFKLPCRIVGAFGLTFRVQWTVFLEVGPWLPVAYGNFIDLPI
jgi:hypothetical protein